MTLLTQCENILVDSNGKYKTIKFCHLALPMIACELLHISKGGGGVSLCEQHPTHRGVCLEQTLQVSILLGFNAE